MKKATVFVSPEVGLCAMDIIRDTRAGKLSDVDAYNKLVALGIKLGPIGKQQHIIMAIDKSIPDSKAKQ